MARVAAPRPERKRKPPKDGFARDVMYSLRMPSDLREWLSKEAQRRSLAGTRTSPADLIIEATRALRTRTLWKRVA